MMTMHCMATMCCMATMHHTVTMHCMATTHCLHGDNMLHQCSLMAPLQTDMQVAINAMQCHNKNDASADKFFSFKFLSFDLFSLSFLYSALEHPLGAPEYILFFLDADAISVHVGKKLVDCFYSKISLVTTESSKISWIFQEGSVLIEN